MKRLKKLFAAWYNMQPKPEVKYCVIDVQYFV